MGQGTIILLDDRPASIEEYIDAIRHYGFRAEIFTGLLSLASFLESAATVKADVKAMVIDLHIAGAQRVTAHPLSRLSAAAA